MKYSTETQFLSQECSLNVQDSVVDAIAYRSGINGISVDVDVTNVSGGAGATCCGSCISLCFILCTQQFIWNPKCCGKKATESPTSKKKAEKFARYLAFKATEEYVKSYHQLYTYY
jgi:hypothetical protein